MYHLKRSKPRHTGFTLIELLVSIAIIGILIALLVPILGQFLGKGPQLIATSEISKLDEAVQIFKTTWSADYIPSQIKLCEFYGDYGAAQLDQDSISYLTRLWPKLLNPPPGANSPPWQTTGIDWNCDGTTTHGGVTLEGHQCLVFFLGGAQQRPNNANPNLPFACLGFATDPRDPIKLSQATGRKGPYFEFASGRLGIWPGNAAGSTSGFLSFFDPFSQFSPPQAQGGDKPYAYFSNYGQRNAFNDPSSPLNKKYPQGDCASLQVNPYFQPGLTGQQYYNATTQQIICAGANHKFGAGGQWLVQHAGSIGVAGADDHSNFNDGSMLGVGN